MAMKVLDSQWHKELSELGRQIGEDKNPYWLRPFENFKTFCAYQVERYARVATELGRYLDFGFTGFILDIPSSEAELQHASVVFARAQRRTQALGGPAS